MTIRVTVETCRGAVVGGRWPVVGGRGRGRPNEPENVRVRL